MEEIRRPPSLVYSACDVKVWVRQPPAVDAVRPAQCPRCAAPGRPVGHALGLWGHGVRRRQLRGPLDAASAPVVCELVVRRYRCRACTAIVLVVPRGVIARRLFSAGAIGVALARFGIGREPAAQVRAAVSPWRVVGATAATGWLSLRRWTQAVQARRLFARLRPAPPGARLRAMAARAARALSALAPPGGAATLGAAVFAGAAHGG